MVLSQTKKGLLVRVGALDEVLGRGHELGVAGLHALLGQRAGVFDLLLADAAPARLLGGIVFFGGPGVHDAARAEDLLEVGEVRLRRIVHILRLLLGVQVIEVAEELVEAVGGGQVLVLVAEVVLAELAGGVAQRLEQFGNGGIFRLQPDVRAGHAHLGEAGAVGVLPGDEGGAAGGAALLAVRVGEAHPLVGDAVDVGGAIAHQPVAVAAQVGDADVVAPDDEDVRFSVWHGRSSLQEART